MQSSAPIGLDDPAEGRDVMHVKDLPEGVVAMLKTWVVKHNTEKPVRILEVKGPKAGMKAIEKCTVKG